MDIAPLVAKEHRSVRDWRCSHSSIGIDPEYRQQLISLSRRGWAWEFMRRNPEYGIAYNLRLAVPSEPATKWGLLHFVDPGLTSQNADVFWRSEDCTEVLPMAVSCETLVTGATLNLDTLSCRVVFAADTKGVRRDILFRQDGRFLQLAIFGDGDLKEANLVVAALGDPSSVMARTASLRRLNDLLSNKTMRAALYPQESRAPRLIKLLIALDGWLAQMPQREIAILMFSESRVKREWNDPREHLRDQVRRAIAYGQELMNGGYRQFLRLTFARRIAARQGAPRA